MRALLALAAALFSADAASAQVVRPEIRPSEDGGSAYGRYLAGRAALNSGAAGQAAAFLSRAAEAAPDQAFLGERAFTAALLAGEVSNAARVAERTRFSSEQAAAVARLTRAVDAFASGRARDAARLLEEPFPEPIARTVTLLRPYVLFSAGRRKEALVAPAAPSVAPGAPADMAGLLDRAVSVGRELSRARLHERAGDLAGAQVVLEGLVAERPEAGQAWAQLARVLELRGRKDEAVAIYERQAESAPELALAAQAERAKRGGPPPVLPSFESDAADALVAAGQLAMLGRAPELALVHYRLAERMAPEDGGTLLQLANLLTGLQQTEGARTAWRRVPDGSPAKAEAEFRLALSLREEAPEEAVALARSAAERGGTPQVKLALGEFLAGMERYEEAVRTLRAAPLESDGRWWFALGAALERLGRWDEAEPALIKARDLRPEDPEVLNYLGYGWIDRGVRVQEGLALVEKAVAAAPQSGAIQDSLAWAHFKLGDYEKAVEGLEAAVKLEPGNAEINDHLGDAYWRVGRRVEAEFQWRRALGLNPTPAQKTALEAKLRSGLPEGGKAKP